MKDYLENGNIVNSVNMPRCEQGICTVPRIAIIHKNVAGMISQFTQVLGNNGYNISNMTNKSRGDFAYTIIDVESTISDDITEKLRSIDDVIRVRIVKKEV